MSRSRAARLRPSGQFPWLRLLGAGAIAVTALSLAGPATSAAAQPGSGQAQPPVSVSITSVTPAFATAGQIVHVKGTITNNSHAALTGVRIRLRSSSVSFTTRDDLQNYAAGKGSEADSYVPGATTRQPITVQAGQSVRWSAPLRVSRAGMTAFGVYPLAAEADSASNGPLPGGISRTFLPYWPPRKHGQPQPARQQIAWVLPLINQPDQGACPGLLNNGLAGSLSSSGRLGSLLAAGRAEAASTHLTWAIDPALLSAAKTMTKGYPVGSDARCGTHKPLPASKAAAAWLASLHRAAAGRPVLITPYADVDVAALTRQSLNADLADAFAEGRQVAGSILDRSFSPVASGAPASTSSTTAAAPQVMAWPPDGIANHAVLENLAADKIRTVILDSSTMQPRLSPDQTFAPDNAVTSTPDGVNGDMRVLLSDHTITTVLGSASATAGRAASFAVQQRFLAETAMIAAQLPGRARSIVVAPPRRWSPPPGLARHLLAQTTRAPWLKPVSLSQLASSRVPAQRYRALRTPVSGELSRRLLHQVRQADGGIALLHSIQVRPDPALRLAVAGVESAAWRGGSQQQAHAQALLNELTTYLRNQQKGLTIFPPVQATLGGLRGTVPVSVRSRLSYPVKVRVGVTVPGSENFAVAEPAAKVVPPGSVVKIGLKVHASAVGTTIISIGLLSPDGHVLPSSPVKMTIRATHFGTLALVILVAALGIFTIASAARAMRQGGAKGGRHGQPDPGHDAPESAQRPPDPQSAGTVEAEQPDQRAAGHPGTDGAHTAGSADPMEETDELARAPGWADQG
ncbi:MAG TPA: DUF6049 family protein [Streptosporangiaceae bacterium]